MLIELNDITTWPPQIKRIFEMHHQLLSNHAKRKKEISLMPLTKSLNEENSFQVQRNAITHQLSEIIKNHEIVMYHCTRLLDDEISEIKVNGLLPLSLELMEYKFKKAKESGFLSKKEIENLLLKNECHEENRSGKIWFVGGVSVLSKEDAVIDLFTFWGGEALYNSHDRSNLLKKIGTSCIIKCSVNTRILQLNYSRLADIFETAYLKDTEEAQFDDYIEEPLLPDKIIKIYKKNDPDFKRLTNYHEWQSHF